jgi:hypothetical protein
MRDMVAVCAVLGGIIELLAAIGGPQLAGVGIRTAEPPPAMGTVPLVVGLAVGVISILGGSLVSAGRNGQRWGVALVIAAVVGAWVVGQSTGWFIFGAFFTLLAGVMAVFVRRRRTMSG